jgi:uncharacterized PurR-regulated membrane protein YhhQ (DUF165 family)
MVQAYEAGVTARGRGDSARLAAGKADSGPILIGRSSEISWGGAPQEREGFFSRVGGMIRAALRLVVPVLLLLGILSASYMYGDIKIPAISIAPWLSLGHALIMVPFFAVMLTNRRYGPSYALAQVVVTMGVIGSVTVANAADLSTLVPEVAHIPERMAIAFACAFFAANFAGIVAFDAARGPRWWSAPLISAFFCSAVFAGVFYTAAYFGTDENWTNHMLVHGGVLFGAGIAMLLPYHLLRRIVPPLPGYNGY